jgi:hypothetical protein
VSDKPGAMIRRMPPTLFARARPWSKAHAEWHTNLAEAVASDP